MIRKLAARIREYKKASILSPLIVMMEVVIECIIPFLTAKLVNEIDAGCDLLTICKYGGILIVMAILSLTCGALAGHFCATASCGFAKNLRRDLFHKVQEFSFGNIDKFSTSSLVTRLTTDVNNVQMSFMMLVMLFMIYPRASVSAKRIMEVLDTPLSIRDGKENVGSIGKRGEVEFRNVTFRYPDAEEDVLHQVSFTAHKGETVAFIGSTGSGKSTVINLVPRFYDATEGEVLVNGVNVKDYTQYELRNKIGYVSQKAILFSGTVRDNVAFGNCGRNVDGNIVEAVYTAQASEFVEKMEGGYDAHIAQGGSNLSGGQKQRLSIARAVCRNPEIMIFDDSFSALDYKTDRELRKRLNTDCRDCTKLIVAQRIGTIRDADRIVVLDEGKVVGMGTHDELMRSCEVYQQIAYSQLSKEELA